MRSPIPTEACLCLPVQDDEVIMKDFGIDTGHTGGTVWSNCSCIGQIVDSMAKLFQIEYCIQI
uniref:Bm675 n=1 Tax=Brugia malayi TaxID=6279 RepID=A0A0H5SAK5_BRUMA|nr:Bm675 [Brugia malayi]